MKKLLICTIIFIFIVLWIPGFAASATTLEPTLVVNGAEEQGVDPYYNFVDYVENNPNRTVCTEEEFEAATYIESKLSDIYPDTSINQFDFMLPEYQFYTVVGENKETSQNVVSYKRSGKEDAKLLVIGAYYGNLTKYATSTTTVVGGEGALFNGTGVAVLLSLALQLEKVSLSYDVAFVFFGAELLGNYGSAEFLKKNSQSLLGMINLTGVGGGDDLYIYYDEVKRSHGLYLDELIKKNGYNIQKTPFNKKYLLGGDEYPYSHVGLAGSNSTFIKDKVPSVNLFGYNWSSIGASESGDKPNLSGTSLDTLENFVELYGEEEIKEKLDLTLEFLINALTDDLFEEKFVQARTDSIYSILNSSKFKSIIKWSLFGAFVIIVLLLILRAGKISKNAEPIYEKTIDNDIYGLEEEEKDVLDDIFDEF